MSLAFNHHTQTPDLVIWSLIDTIIQNQNEIDIPAIVFEYLSDDNNEFDNEDLFNFYEKFGDIEHFELKGKKSVILFKTFFAANQCKVFLQNEKNYNANMKNEFGVRWFAYEEDSQFLSNDSCRIKFEKKLIHYNQLNNKNNAYNLQLELLKNTHQGSDINYQHIKNKNKNKDNNKKNEKKCNDYNDVLYNQNAFGEMNSFYSTTNLNDNQYHHQHQHQHNQQQLLLHFSEMSIKNWSKQLNEVDNFFHQNKLKPSIRPPNANANILHQKEIIKRKSSSLASSSSSSSSSSMYNHDRRHPIILTKSINKKNIIDDYYLNANNLNGKYTCRYEILIPNDKEFQIVKKLIGPNGYNMKKIIDACKTESNKDNVKLRLRGKGSGFKEGVMKIESDEALHLCISSKKFEYTIKACHMVNDLLERIYDEYIRYCEKAKCIPIRQIAIRVYCGNSCHNNSNNSNNSHNYYFK